MMELSSEARQRIACVLGQRACRVERHVLGACMTVPQALQVIWEALE